LDLKKIWKRKKKHENEEELVIDGIRVPKEWLKGKSKQRLEKEFVIVKPKKRKKYRIPHLRFIKRLIVGIGFLFNFISSQVLFFSPIYESKIMGFIFLFQAYICLDYLWQTRYDIEILRKVMKSEKKIEE